MSRPARTLRTLWLFVVALVLAPALASVWPALGRGPMLYTGEPAAHVAHDHQAVADAAHECDEAHVSGANTGAESHHADHDAQPDHTNHAQHCALCVLVSLAWAPVVHVAPGADAPPAVHRRALQRDTSPRSQVVWSRAQARAPPAFS